MVETPSVRTSPPNPTARPCTALVLVATLTSGDWRLVVNSFNPDATREVLAGGSSTGNVTIMIPTGADGLLRIATRHGGYTSCR